MNRKSVTNFSHQPLPSNGCHDTAQKSMSFNDAAIVTVKKHDNRINLWFLRKAEAVSRMIMQA